MKFLDAKLKYISNYLDINSISINYKIKLLCLNPLIKNIKNKQILQISNKVDKIIIKIVV
jgi:hypothetical protein